MKKKIFISVFMILVSVAMITAATMAWFTDSANAGKPNLPQGLQRLSRKNNRFSDSESGTKYGTFLPDKVVEADQEKDIDENVLPEDRIQMSFLTTRMTFSVWVLVEH